MRKEIKSFLVLLAALVVIASFAAYSLLKSPDKEYFKLAHDELEVVLEEIREVRGLNPKTDISIEVVTISWIEENWALPYAESQREEIYYEEIIYKALFLLPSEANLTEIRINQFKATMAAAVGDKVYLTKEYFDPSDELKALEILAHEITHIIQRQHFNPPERSTHDGKQARSALIEGDALITAEEFVLHHFGIKIGDLSNMSYSPIEEVWLFPYKYGRSFVRGLLEAGGWDMVNSALKNPPNTTEQILHPEKYLACEGFVVPDSPSLEGMGWKRIKSDRMGEHFILTILSTSLSEERATEAAKGWNGDNLTLYMDNDAFMIEWVIVWDSEQDATQFAGSFQELLEKRGDRLPSGVWYCIDRYVFLHVSEASMIILISNDLEAINASLPLIKRDIRRKIHAV